MNWVRGNYLCNPISDGSGLLLGSPDISQGPQWTPPAIQAISMDDYETPTNKEQNLRQFSFTPTIQGTSANPDSSGSTSSRSDSSESESRVKLRSSSYRNFSNRLSFMSKPVFPISIPNQTSIREASGSSGSAFSDYESSTPQREAHRWSSASSSVDFLDASEPIESETYDRSPILRDGSRCGLCERFLSQRSPWGSRRIVRSGDMPVTGVLSCCHVFHAECLEQTTPKMCKNDPPCPVCIRLEEGSSPGQQISARLRNGFPRVRQFREDGPSRPWGCTQVADFVEGGLHRPSRNTVMFLNRNRFKKNLSLKGNSSKEFPGKLMRSGTYSSQLLSGKSIDQVAAVGCSNTSA